MTEKKTDVSSRGQLASSREQQPLARRETMWPASPFRLLERFANEIDSVFGDFGLGRSVLAPRGSRTQGTGLDLWVPQVEVSQQNNELVVRADLPGLKKEDVTVDITDDAITIAGERRREQETEQGGVYRSERSYGSFFRTIPVPEGAIVDQAKATFKDGVLEIRMPAPPDQVTRGRRLEIKDGTDTKK
jgi:HSP20 family protein